MESPHLKCRLIFHTQKRGWLVNTKIHCVNVQNSQTTFKNVKSQIAGRWVSWEGSITQSGHQFRSFLHCTNARASSLFSGDQSAS